MGEVDPVGSSTRTVRIFDTTLRDGEQTPGVSLASDEKLQIARHLEALEVDIIEAGFPAASRGELKAVSSIAREVRGPSVCALARTHRGDIDAAWEAIREAERPRIHLFISTSDIHLRHMMKMGREEAVDLCRESVTYARGLCDDVQFSAQDATRTDLDYLVQIVEAALEAGATVINIPDTVGYTIPREYRELFLALRSRLPRLEEVTLSAHTHDDLGLATANALAAVEGGATQLECAVNGIGERAGNCALEEAVMALHTRGSFFDCRTRLNTTHLHRVSRLVANLTGIPVQPNKAVVGAHAFAHESGIHQDGMLKERSTYEIMRPQDVGLDRSTLVLGKHSGRHAFRTRLEELGYHLNSEELARAFARFKELADRRQGVTDADLEAIVHNQISRTGGALALDYFLITSGNKAIPSATVRVNLAEEARESSSPGDGPVDAIFKAIDGALGRRHRLVDYSIQAVTGGASALGDVTVRVEVEDQIYLGRGLSTDILEASAQAYVAAINRYLESRGLETGDLAAAYPGPPTL